MGANEVGEICIDCPSKTIGYYKNPEANAESFTPRGYFKTGDMGYYDDEGQLWIVGRYKDIIIQVWKSFISFQIIIFFQINMKIT